LAILDCPYTHDKGEWTAETEEDARQMAIDFAQSVSHSVSESSSGLARYMFSLSENFKKYSGNILIIKYKRRK
jgi:RIO-like serine/threonine protein kinase